MVIRDRWSLFAGLTKYKYLGQRLKAVVELTITTNVAVFFMADY